MRQQAIKAVGQGESPAQIARALCIDVRSVYLWIAAYAPRGTNANYAQPILGRSAIAIFARKFPDTISA